ncbi:MAG: AI-2E family transporter [Halapricum sp.]
MDRARAIVVGLIGLLLVLAALLVRPFLEFVLLSVLLAFPLRHVQRRLKGRFGERRTAAGLVVGTTVTVLLPLAWLLWIVLRETTTFVKRVQRGDVDFSDVEASIQNVTGQDIDLLEVARRLLQETGIGTVDGAVGVFGTAADLLIGTALSVFLLYYFLKDADRFGRWLERTVPLPERVYSQLHREFNDVMWAVLASHVFIAVVQGVVAGLGLVVLGVPNATFWTVVMVFLAVMPIIGSFLVWGPAVVYLLSVERPVAGVALLVYGTIVVSFSDDFLRPLVIDRYTETRLNPGAIVLGVVGGIYVFGFIGIFFGPVIIGALRAVLDTYRREYVEHTSATEAGE